MNLFIKEWPNNSATVMTDTGKVLFTFPTIESARVACRDWSAACAGTHNVGPIRNRESGIVLVD